MENGIKTIGCTIPRQGRRERNSPGEQKDFQPIDTGLADKDDQSMETGLVGNGTIA